MQKQTRLKQVTTVKTTVRYRLLYTAGATLAIAALVGVGLFFYGNFGNNPPAKASSQKKEGLGGIIKNIFAPKGPSEISVAYNDGAVILKWLNGSDTKAVPDANGVLILRKTGIVTDEQSVTELETDSAKYAAAGAINGWNIVYNGALTNTYTDNTSSGGAYTYLVYLRKNGVKYTTPKNAARTFAFNGTGLSETITTKVTVDGLSVPAGCTLTIADNATLEIKTGSALNIAGTFVLSGDIDDESKSWTFAKGSEFIYSRNGGMTGVPDAKWESGSTCTMKGITNKIPPGLDQDFSNFTWDCTGQSTDLTLPKQIAVAGNINIKSTGKAIKTLWLEGNNSFKGNLIVNDATAKVNTRSKSQVNINGTSNQSIQGTWNFQTVSFDNSSTVSNEGVITVNRVLNMVSGTIVTESSPFKIADGATINRTNGSISGTPLFLHVYNLCYRAPVTTGEELAASASALNDLSVQCAGNVTLNRTATVNGTLTFTSGKIVTGNYEVDMKSTSANSIKGYSTNNYIAGNLRRSTNGKSNYDFPIGTTANYELIDINLYSTTGFTDLQAHFTVAKPDAAPLPSSLVLNGSPVGNALDYGYWTVTPNSPLTSGNYTVTVNERGQTNAATSVRCYCVMSRDDANSSWKLVGKHSMKTQSANNGTVTAARSKMTAFGDYSVGFSAISLLLYQSAFTANLDKDQHADIIWRTSGDLNYTTLVLERSRDAYGFEPLGELKEGKEKGSTTEYNFCDKQPFPGTSYYRIKQIDSDGKISYTDIKYITNDSKTKVTADTEK